MKRMQSGDESSRIRTEIESGQTVLGMEFGSTRIKAVLLDRSFAPIAGGETIWGNRLENGIFTYHADEMISGLQSTYAALKKDVGDRYGALLQHIGAIGVSGMMHGYFAFDSAWHQLVPFYTWRNTMTKEAAEKLSALFDFNIPQRWSVAHLYQAMLSGQEHLAELSHLTTLAGWMHYRLTGVNAVGAGEASGMFPIDPATGTYDAVMAEKMDRLLQNYGLNLRVSSLFPKVLAAGEDAGFLTPEGALLLDPEGDLAPGIFFAPCEGDAGTGMAATNSLHVGTGNVSAGTSDFAMVVVGRKLPPHREIDMVATPAGQPVAMVHCNNFTSDLNAWIQLFLQFSKRIGADVSLDELYPILFREALSGARDGGGLLSYNYSSGEGVTDIDAGRPVFLRKPDAELTLPNFMRTHLMSALATLKIGLDILTKKEQVSIDTLYGHGGFFKTPEVGQRFLAAAANVPISVMETAGEGGPYGMALLAAFRIWKQDGEGLEDFMEKRVFSETESTVVQPDPEDVRGFDDFIVQYEKAFDVERTATARF